MFGPGAYRPDPTEGITAIADLPPPEIVPYSRNDKRQPCPRCGHSAYRDKQFQRTLHDLVTVQVVKTGITPQRTLSDGFREAKTEPLPPAGRLHRRQ